MIFSPVLVATMTVATVFLAAQNEATGTNPPNQGPLPAAVTTQASDAEVTNAGPAPTAIPKLSYGLEEVVKMVQSGAGTDVVLSYVENSPLAYAPTADDVIRLHELAVPSPVIVAILRHGGKLRTQQMQANQQNQAPVVRPTAAAPNYYSSYNNSDIATPAADSTYAYAGYPAYSYYYPSYYPSYWYGSYPGFWFGYTWPYYNCGHYYSHGSWGYYPRYNNYYRAQPYRGGAAVGVNSGRAFRGAPVAHAPMAHGRGR